MREVGKTIAQLRMEKGLRQKDLSNILSLSPSSISNYETGAYWPDLSTLCEIADYFNVTTDYLLGRTDYRCSPEILDKYVTKDYAVHNIVNTLLTLDSASVDAVLKYVDYLKANHSQSTEKTAASPINSRKASETAGRTKKSSVKDSEKKSKKSGA